MIITIYINLKFKKKKQELKYWDRMYTFKYVCVCLIE